MAENKNVDDVKQEINDPISEVEIGQETEADYYALKKWELGFLRVCASATLK